METLKSRAFFFRMLTAPSRIHIYLYFGEFKIEKVPSMRNARIVNNVSTSTCIYVHALHPALKSTYKLMRAHQRHHDEIYADGKLNFLFKNMFFSLLASSYWRCFFFWMYNIFTIFTMYIALLYASRSSIKHHYTFLNKLSVCILFNLVSTTLKKIVF